MSDHLNEQYTRAVSTPDPIKPKRPAPLSIRLSEKEKSELRRLAGGQSLNAYVKSQIFGGKLNKSTGSHETLALILFELGKSEFAANIKSIAQLAEIGALIMDEETRTNLNAALAAIIAMRDAIVKELKTKSGR